MIYAEASLPAVVSEERLNLDKPTIRGLAYCALMGPDNDPLGFEIAAALEALPPALTLTELGGIYQDVRHYVDERLPRRFGQKFGHHHAREAMATIATEAAMKEDSATVLNVCRILEIEGHRRARQLSLYLRIGLLANQSD